MNWTESDIQEIRDYLHAKLRATKSRAEVLAAVTEGPFDFILLDTRSRDAFAFGHIPGAWCAPFDELGSLIPRLPKDREIVTYCSGHD